MTDIPQQVALIFQTRHVINSEVLRGIASYERRHCDWNFFLDDQAVSTNNPAWLFRKNWDGIICRHPGKELYQQSIERGIPLVSLSDPIEDEVKVPTIQGNNRAIGQVGAEHLIDRAFTNFAFSGFKNERWSQIRLQGFEEGLKIVGHEVHIQNTFYPQKLTPEWDIAERDKIVSWVENLPKPLAIMACNDLRALQIIGALRDAGYLIPDEVAVLGAGNDVTRAELSHPPLSSVPLNNNDWGYKAAEMLDRLIRGKTIEKEVFIDPLQVVTRRSTDAFAIEDEATLNAVRIIQTKCHQNISVEELAKAVGLSRSLLERRFRKYLRRSPQEVIRNEKIRLAKKLLEETDDSLATIAEKLDFNHSEYLSVMFKRLTGESPRDYRNRQRQSEK